MGVRIATGCGSSLHLAAVWCRLVQFGAVWCSFGAVWCKMCEQPVANTTWEWSLFSPQCESRAIAQLVTELSADPVPDDVPIPLRLAVCPSVSRSQYPLWCFSTLATKLKPLDKLRQSGPPAVQNLHVLHTSQLEGCKSHVLSWHKSTQPTQRA